MNIHSDRDFLDARRPTVHRFLDLSRLVKQRQDEYEPE